MSRFVNKQMDPTNPRRQLSKQNISNQARRDLKELEIARRQANLVNQAKKRTVSEVSNQRESSSSDDSDVEDSRAAPKTPRLDMDKDDEEEIMFVGEFASPVVNKPHLQLNLASDLCEVDPREGNMSRTNPLVSFLTDEIKAEKQGEGAESEMPIITDFEISTDRAQVTLKKQFGNEKIRVLFNINSSLYFASDEASAPISLPEFKVEVVKGSGTLRFDAILDETDQNNVFDVRIESYCFLPTVHPNQAKQVKDDSIYKLTLNNATQEMQENLIKYLQERGITRKFCSELITFSTYYEHNCYVGLLEQTKNLIK